MKVRDIVGKITCSMDESETVNPGTTSLVDPQAYTAEPKQYRILLHNDDYTPMEFVIEVVQEFFHKSFEQANQIMLDVHNKGAAVCGFYSYEIAETKVAAVSRRSRENDYPLKCTMEPD